MRLKQMEKLLKFPSKDGLTHAHDLTSCSALPASKAFWDNNLRCFKYLMFIYVDQHKCFIKSHY